MMLRPINLFGSPLRAVNRRAYIAQQIRYVSVLFSILLFGVVFGLHLYRAKLIGDIRIVQEQSTIVEQAISQELARQKDLASIVVRIRKIEDALTQDVQYASKSAMIQELFNDIGVNVRQDEFTLSNTTDFRVRLSFGSEKDLLSFIREMESEVARSKLKQYSIGTFKLSIATSSGSLIPLDFSGTFL